MPTMRAWIMDAFEWTAGTGSRLSAMQAASSALSPRLAQQQSAAIRGDRPVVDPRVQIKAVDG